MPPLPSRKLVAPLPASDDRLAINIADLTRIEPTVRAMLLAGKLDPSGAVIRTDPARPDESAVEFACDLLTAACVADVIRGHDRRSGDYPCRVYLRSGKGAWRKLPSAAILTVVPSQGPPVLSPDVFAVRCAPVPPPAAKRVTMGNR